MKSLLEQLKEHWATTSEEQLQEEWNEIKAMGLEGPDALEFAQSFQLEDIWIDNSFITVGEISNSFSGITKTNQNFNEKFQNDVTGNYQYAMAA